MNRRLCRHCQLRPNCRRGGLCAGCFMDPAIRDEYPKVRQTYPERLDGPSLEYCVMTVRSDMAEALKTGPKMISSLSKITAYPVATLRDALDGAKEFSILRDRVRLKK